MKNKYEKSHRLGFNTCTECGYLSLEQTGNCFSFFSNSYCNNPDCELYMIDMATGKKIKNPKRVQL